MKGDVVFRVQARDGRGPYRPGVTDQWADADGPDHPPIQMDFGMDWLNEIPAGWAAGCAFRSAECAARWFSPSECARLGQIGFAFVALGQCRVIRENQRQMIVVRPLPFRMKALVLPWPHSVPATLNPWKATHHAR